MGKGFPLKLENDVTYGYLFLLFEKNNFPFNEITKDKRVGVRERVKFQFHARH